MEHEFLDGIAYKLFVDETTYESWLNLLEGLVAAKEREFERWRRWRGGVGGGVAGGMGGGAAAGMAAPFGVPFGVPYLVVPGSVVRSISSSHC